MEEISPSSPKKGLKILIIIAVVAIILFVAVFGVLYALKKEKSMYTDFSAVIADPYQSDYIESSSNLNAIDARYPNTLTDFSITSNTLQARLNYYLPYLVHLKFDAPTRRKAGKLLNDFSNIKDEFEVILEETRKNALESSDTQKKQALYYGAFLPTYRKYISAKYDVVKFIENYFSEVGFAFSPYLTNLNHLTYIYVDFSINLALPSIYASNANVNNFSKFISSNSGMSLNFLYTKFNEFKNTFKNNTNEFLTANFNKQIKLINKSFNIMIDAYNSLHEEQQKNFLVAPKVKPQTISASSVTYVTDFLLSYFAVEDGAFLTDLNSANIINYFAF